MPAARVRLFNSLGHSTPPVHELRRTAQTGTRFHKAITSAAEAHPAGAQVYVYSPDEYANMRLFLTEDGKAGFALNGDDIVSVFNHRKSNYQGVTAELLALAVEQGGRRLDAFDTYLPHLYERFGFQIVRREPWNEKRKPKGWDKEHFRKYNHGEPDVVFMEYRPTKKVVDEMAKKNRVLDLNQQPQPVPISENIDLSRFDDRLRQTLG